MQLHNHSKDEYGYVYCYLMLYRFIYGHSLSSYGTVPVLASVDWPYSRKAQCWRNVLFIYLLLLLFFHIRRPPSIIISSPLKANACIHSALHHQLYSCLL